MNASWNVVCVINSFNVEFSTNNLFSPFAIHFLSDAYNPSIYYSLLIFMTSWDEETDKDGYIGKKVKEIGFILVEKFHFALLKRALQLAHKMKMYKMLTQS